MQRHFPDQGQVFSAHPGTGNGNARGLTLGQPRGTVSMPTSPIQAHVYPWSEGPQTAQAYFNIPAEPEPFNPSPDVQGYYEPNYLDESSVLGARPLSGGEGQPPRKKRAQVRIACTHCQKACKKCSNTRPCERCVKYGLKDCVDSSRKPRKTGVKRGPYKRRASKYPDDLSSSLSLSTSPLPPNTEQLDPNQRFYHAHQHQHPLQSPHAVNGSPHTHSHPHQHAHPGLPSPPSQQAMPAGPGPAWNPRRSSEYAYQPEARPSAPQVYPPPPRSSLGGVFAAALSGPRWINGERLVAPPTQRPHHDVSADVNMGAPGSGAGGTETPGVMYPVAPMSTFPLSLGIPPRSGPGQGGMADPFSRAVSPLGARPVVAHHLVSPPNELANSAGEAAMDVDPLLSAFGFDPSLIPAEGPNGSGTGSGCVSAPPEMTTYGLQSMLGGPYNFPQAVSAPVSPRTPSVPWPDVRPAPRSSSTEPPSTAANVPQPMFGMGPMGRAGGYTSPAMVALKRVRKPSLKTLMSNTTSANNSPLGSPMLAPLPPLTESPTLFDQPMNVEMEGWLDSHEPRTATETEDGRKEVPSPNRTGDLSFGGMLEIGFSS